jgi:RNA polymerase sigma-70 factor (ECF subfamily)
MVLRRCRALLRDEEAAVDAMQDTFVQLVRHQDRIRGEAHSRLLYRIATNVCLNRIRTRRRRPEDPDDVLLAQIAAMDEEGPRLARNLLDRLFAREQESTRVIAVLHLLDGLTLEEVAEQVGMSVSGVRKRLRPLRERLERLEAAGRGVVA